MKMLSYDFLLVLSMLLKKVNWCRALSVDLSLLLPTDHISFVRGISAEEISGVYGYAHTTISDWESEEIPFILGELELLFR